MKPKARARVPKRNTYDLGSHLVAFAVLVFAVFAVIVAFAIWISSILVGAIEADCAAHCEAEGTEMVALTVFGCTCKANDEGDG